MNLTGLLLPLCAAVISIPILILNLGSEKFGIFSVFLGVVGYSSVLDLGIGRALTQMISSNFGEDKVDKGIEYTIRAGVKCSIVCGIAFGMIIGLIVFFVSEAYISKSITSGTDNFYLAILMSLAVMSQTVSSAYKGANEGLLNFGKINLIRVAVGILNFGIPCYLSTITDNLTTIVAGVVASRIVGLVLFKFTTRVAKKCNLEQIVFLNERDVAVKLLTFGGWQTASNIISALMLQSDRWMIGSMLTAVAVTTYVVPYEVAVQLLVFVNAITTVAFPNLSRITCAKNRDLYFNRIMIQTSLFMVFVCIVFFLFIPDLLKMWIGLDFDSASVDVARILTIGVFANSIGALYYTQLNARGMVFQIACVHAVELPLYLLTLYYLIQEYGVLGAALAWSARMLLDLLLLRGLVRNPWRFAFS